VRYIALVLSLALVGLSCSDDEEASSFCEHRAELQSSIEQLRDVNVLDDGIDELQARLQAVVADAETLRGSAGELEPEADALRSAITTARDAIAAAPTPAGKATALVDGLAAISAAWATFQEAVGAGCD
jgi:chromosome segregation ATPase